MAKAGKDPLAADNKRNARMEKRIRKRLKQGNKKRQMLTRENVVKLPNVSKLAKVMRWIGIQRIGVNVVLENGWTGEADSTTLLVGGETHKVGLKKRQSMGLKSMDEEGDSKMSGETGRDFVKSENYFADNVNKEEDHGRLDTAGAQIKKPNKQKQKKLRRRPKVAQRRKAANHVAHSEESFVINKFWQIKVADKKSVSTEEDVEDFSPRSGDSVVVESNTSLSCDSGDSAVPVETPPSTPRRDKQRFPTPETEIEPEPENEASQSDEDEEQMKKDCESQVKSKGRSTAMSNWKMLRPSTSS